MTTFRFVSTLSRDDILMAAPSEHGSDWRQHITWDTINDELQGFAVDGQPSGIIAVVTLQPPLATTADHSTG